MISSGVKAVNTLSNCQVVDALWGGVLRSFVVKIYFFKWWHLKICNLTILTILNSPCTVIKSYKRSSVQSHSHVRLCNPMDCSTPGLPFHCQLPEFIQTHVHWVGDAIQPSHPLSSPSPPAFNRIQHQDLF